MQHDNSRVCETPTEVIGNRHQSALVPRRRLTLPSSGPAYGGPLKSNVRRQRFRAALSLLRSNSKSTVSVPRQVLNADSLGQALQGQQVSHVTGGEVQQLTIHFSNGASLRVDASTAELAVETKQLKYSSGISSAQRPTGRQLEYLAFIAKYIGRFGRSPAESDIERHFLVSAPSVNQMMQTLERRGFITRQKGVPRSVRICIALQQGPLK